MAEDKTQWEMDTPAGKVKGYGRTPGKNKEQKSVNVDRMHVSLTAVLVFVAGLAAYIWNQEAEANDKAHEEIREELKEYKDENEERIAKLIAIVDHTQKQLQANALQLGLLVQQQDNNQQIIRGAAEVGRENQNSLIRIKERLGIEERE